MAAQIDRDPFARASLMRRSLPASSLGTYETCVNCGGRNGHNGLFQYRWEEDGIGKADNRWSRPVCGKGCYESYYCN